MGTSAHILPILPHSIISIKLPKNYIFPIGLHQNLILSIQSVIPFGRQGGKRVTCDQKLRFRKCCLIFRACGQGDYMTTDYVFDDGKVRFSSEGG